MSIWRRNARHDENHAEIVGALRAHGASVVSINAPGCPDLLVGVTRKDGTRVNLLLEVKRPLGPKGGKSHRDLTERQRHFRAGWRGDLPWVVRSPLEAIAVLGYEPDGGNQG